MQKKVRANSKESRLVRFLNEEFLFSIRKSFVMYGQIGFRIEDVTSELITIDISASGKGGDETAQLQVVYNVRNAILGQLGDLIPCPEFRAFFTDRDAGVHRKEVYGRFYDPDQDEFLLPTSCVPLLHNVMKARDKHRARFNKEWERLGAPQQRRSVGQAIWSLIRLEQQPDRPHTKCPSCGSKEIIPIVYGLPSPEDFERAARGEIELGGCCIVPVNRRCRSCNYMWHDPSDSMG
jgi:hypothetical protein